MARPRYIICSETRLTEQSSGLISHVNVIETLTFMQFATQQELTASLDLTKERAGVMPRCTVTAVWMRGEDDTVEDEFEVQTLIHRPVQLQISCMKEVFASTHGSIELRYSAVLGHQKNLDLFDSKVG